MIERKIVIMEEKLDMLEKCINDFKNSSDVHINENDDLITIRQKDMLFGKIQGLEMALELLKS